MENEINTTLKELIEISEAYIEDACIPESHRVYAQVAKARDLLALLNSEKVRAVDLIAEAQSLLKPLAAMKPILEISNLTPLKWSTPAESNPSAFRSGPLVVGDCARAEVLLQKIASWKASNDAIR